MLTIIIKLKERYPVNLPPSADLEKLEDRLVEVIREQGFEGRLDDIATGNTCTI